MRDDDARALIEAARKLAGEVAHLTAAVGRIAPHIEALMIGRPVGGSDTPADQPEQDVQR